MHIVLKIGGSILFDKDKIRVELISNLIEQIQLLLSIGHKIGIVVGGGSPAREYIAAAKEMGANTSYLDYLGIESARQNARLIISGLKEAYPEPPKNFEELMLALGSHDLVICGGFQPGQSTNAVAAIFAEYFGASYLFNLTNVDKVYNKDPTQFADAQSYEKMTYLQLAKVISTNEQNPGTYALFDHVGLEIVRRSNIKLVFLDGKKPEHILDVIENRSRGTTVALY